ELTEFHGRTRTCMLREPLGQSVLRHCVSGNVEDELDSLVLWNRQIPSVHAKECEGRCERCALVPIDERVVLADVEQIGSGHSKGDFVRDLAAKALLRNRER